MELRPAVHTRWEPRKTAPRRRALRGVGRVTPTRLRPRDSAHHPAAPYAPDASRVYAALRFRALSARPPTRLRPPPPPTRLRPINPIAPSTQDASRVATLLDHVISLLWVHF